MISDNRTKIVFMSLILRVGWVWTLEKYVTKFYVTIWDGRGGLNPNIYVRCQCFLFEGFPYMLCFID